MRFRSARRFFALGAAAGAAVLGGPSLPAAAQSLGPPPYVPVGVSSGPLSPQPYKQAQGCMQGAAGAAVVEEKPWAQLTLGFEQAHQQTVPETGQPLTGSGQRIAVIDTGINTTQHRLPAVDTSGGSSVPNGGAGVDCDGHGTAVAGIIAAQPSADTGFVGIAPGSTLMSLRQSSANFKDEQSGQTIGNTSTMAQAIQYAVNNGAGVINISQSSCQAIAAAANPNDTGNRQLQTAVHQAAERGVVVVAAAGNAQDQCQKNPVGNPTTAVLPAWFDDDVLTVASVGQQGNPSAFTVPGPWVDVAAPGENLTSVDPGQGGQGVVNQISTGQGQPGPIQGTSFAAPYVSGLAALIKQKYPNLSATEVMDRIKKTSLSPGGPGGRNDIVGYGMIDPMAALDDVIPAEYGQRPAPAKPARLAADVIPQPNWAALTIAFGGTVGGIGAVLFTAFLLNARRFVRTRREGHDDES